MSTQNSLAKQAATAIAGRRAVRVNPSNEAAYPTNSLTGSVGVSMDNADTPAGDYLAIITSGVTYCDASGSISAGDWLTTSADGDGKLISAANLDTSQFLIGQAVSDATGGLVQVNVAPSFAASGSFA